MLVSILLVHRDRLPGLIFGDAAIAVLKIKRLAFAGPCPAWLLDETALRAYSLPMTKLLEQAIDAVRRLPPETQDDLGRFLLELASEEPLTPDEIAAIDEAEAEIAHGEGISGKELQAFWRSLGV